MQATPQFHDLGPYIVAASAVQEAVHQFGGPEEKDAATKGSV
jgi:hypothetical protein